VTLLEPRPEEYVPASDRLAVLSALRAIAAGAVLSIAHFDERAQDHLIVLTVGYLAIVVGVEIARHSARPASSRAVSSAVFVDGAYLAFAVAATGGIRSLLTPLVFVELAAVTLLASRWEGIELGVWCALFVGIAGAINTAGLRTPAGRVDRADLVVAAGAFLGYGVAVAGLCAVRDRVVGQAREHLAALVELDASIERARGVGELLSTLSDHVCDRLGFHRAAAVLATDEPLGPIATRVLRTGSSVLKRGLDDDRLGGLLPEAVNVVMVPIGADGSRDGVLAAEWGPRRRARIATMTLRTLEQEAVHAALALRHRALLDEVELLATRDHLTGLANRRLLEETLALEVPRSARAGRPVSLLMLDVDHFKDVNDEGGHPAGDAVLRTVADALVRRTKASDLVARLGGDEFAVVLPDCSASDAARVAERVRSAFVAAAAPSSVTLSAGIATIPDHATVAEELLAAADAALYAAKRAGRDRTEIANPGTEYAGAGS
jgi:diguanylate cyclase (GGDEF)-like protein